MTTFERWAQKVEMTESCWFWQGSQFEGGYGYFQNKRAHRVAYEFFKGDIPNGLQLDHLCRIRHCVNPNHLEAVTQHTNILRIRNTQLCPHGSLVRRRCKPCLAEKMRRLRARKRAVEKAAMAEGSTLSQFLRTAAINELKRKKVV